MYSINQNTLIVTKNTGETFHLYDLSSPYYQEFLSWRMDGNIPNVEIVSDVEYKLKKYIPDDILATKSIEHVNFKTETHTPLLEKEVRDHGWLKAAEYYGYNEITEAYDELVVKMVYEWEHNSLGFAVNRQKRLFYVDAEGNEHELKTFPKEDVSARSVDIGRDRRRHLISDLQMPVLQLVAESISAANPAQLTTWGIDLSALSSGGVPYILEYIGRPFIISINPYIINYVDNHDLKGILAHIQQREEGWLDVLSPTIGATLRQFLLSSIT